MATAPAPAPVQRHRTWVVVLLAILAVLAGIMALVDAARYMGWAPVAVTTMLGEYKFVMPQANWFGALMEVIVALIWFMVAGWLWKLNPSGWLFMVVIAVINLIFLLFAIFGQTTMQAIALPALLNILVLILAFIPGTKAAFGQGAPARV
jgi:hypothetical protein